MWNESPRCFLITVESHLSERQMNSQLIHGGFRVREAFDLCLFRCKWFLLAAKREELSSASQRWR